MDDAAKFIGLLKAVTVDCKDDGKNFTVADRLAVIEELLKGTPYKLVANEPLALVYSKREIVSGESVILVSSHVDCLYDACFCDDDGDCLRGTFDNSLGNAAILSLMIDGLLPDNVVVAFTGDEERDSQGAVQAVLALGRMNCGIEAALVLDVTNTGWGSGAHFALENDLAIDLMTAHKIISAVNALGIEYAFRHDAEPDESWDYGDYGIPVLSVCATVGGCLHGNEGVLVRKSSLLPYCNSILTLLGALA